MKPSRRTEALHGYFRIVASSLVTIWLVFPALAQEAEKSDPWRALLLTWGPVLLIVALWLFFMRRLGGSKVGRQVDQSLVHMKLAEEHMKKTEEQNQKILETLERIEEQLRRSPRP